MGLNKYITNKKITGILLFLFISYFSCITLFTHSHIIDGIRIIHSHPYSGTTEEHTHTSSEVEVINHLTFFIALAFIIAGISQLFENKSQKEIRFLNPVTFFKPERFHLLRGPPIC